MNELFAIDTHLAFSESSSCIVRNLDEKCLKEQEEYTKNMQAYEEMAKLPKSLFILKIISSIAAFFLLSVFFWCLTIKNEAGVRDFILYLLFGGAIAFMIVGTALTRHEKQRAKRVASDKGYLELINEGNRIYERCMKSLKVPSLARSIDVFLYIYTTKSGKAAPVNKNIKYINTPIKAFKEGDSLMIADLQTVFAIKKQWFKRVEIIPEKVTFNCWNKNENYGSAKYRSYGVKPAFNGGLAVKGCYKFILEKDGKEFAIVVPPYDGEVLLKLLDLKIKKAK
jgi:hypothetical protein